ncbi:MAG: beta-propeller fold lactonase family protein [Oligoflexus sp.]
MNFRRLLLSAGVVALSQWQLTPVWAADTACLQELELQNTRAFTLGETFYLPKAAAGADCQNRFGVWELTSTPKGSKNQLYLSGAEHPRFTPDLPGNYLFALQGSDSELSLTVVERSPSERFRNHYMTPLYGSAVIGDEIWVANGASYTVTKLQKDQSQNYQVQMTSQVAPWPAAIAGHPELPYVLVAHRAADTVGFVNRVDGVLQDSLWVGDEPSAVALSPDRKRLYVSLATEGKVAVVDLESRQLLSKVAVGFDPRAMSLSKDGRYLYVASYRSANLSYGPDATRPAEDDQDVFVVDTKSLTVIKSFPTIAANLRAIALSDDEESLFVAGSDGETLPSQNDPSAKPFTHLVAEIPLDGGAPLDGDVSYQLTDLTRQLGSAGPAVNPSGVLVKGKHIWVATESSNQVIVLDRNSFEEVYRIPVGHGARHIVSVDGGVAVHCFQSFELFIIADNGQVRQRIKLTDDPRPANVAQGEIVFSRPGLGYANNHSCTSCHIESQNDGMIWRFGPAVWHNIRPIQLLAATTPAGWAGYASNADSFGFMGPSSILNRPPTTEEGESLAAFLGSLLGAPRTTAHTKLDGSFSDEALQGKAIFEGKATCAGCHTPPLYTNRQLIPVGKSGIPADVPSLLGAYRHGVYFVKGQARSVEAAVDVALDYVKVSLTEDEKASLVRFLRELTPKGAHPLGIWPDLRDDTMIPPTAVPYVGFAEPVDPSQPGLSQLEIAQEYVVLEQMNGTVVKTEVLVDGNYIRLKPLQNLTPGARYVFRVKAGLPFQNGGRLEAERRSIFTVAQEPLAKLPKQLQLNVKLAIPGSGTPPAMTVIDLPLTIVDQDENSLLAKLDIGEGRVQTLRIYQSAANIRLQPFALPVRAPTGGSTLADASHVVGKLSVDGDEFLKAEGQLNMGAPGTKIPGIQWEIVALD